MQGKPCGLWNAAIEGPIELKMNNPPTHTQEQVIRLRIYLLTEPVLSLAPRSHSPKRSSLHMSVHICTRLYTCPCTCARAPAHAAYRVLKLCGSMC